MHLLLLLSLHAGCCFVVSECRTLLVPSPTFPTFDSAVIQVLSNDIIELVDTITICSNATLPAQVDNVTIVATTAVLETHVDCMGSGSFLNLGDSVGSVSLVGIRFKNSSSSIISGSASSSFRLVNCSFSAIISSAAVKLSSLGHASIANCNFVDTNLGISIKWSSSNSSLIVSGSYFGSNKNGSVVVSCVSASCTNNTLKIVDCTFVGNTRFGNGAGVAWFSRSNITCNNHFSFENNVFSSNDVTGLLNYYGGGAISLSFLQGTAANNSIQFSQCQFYNNSAIADAGGVFILFVQPSTQNRVLFDQCAFERQSSGLAGSSLAIFFIVDAVSNEIVVSNSIFQNNAVSQFDYAAGILISLETGVMYNKFAAINTSFINNMADSVGGSGIAIFNTWHNIGSEIRVSGCSFDSNMANNGGGGAGMEYFELSGSSNTSIVVENSRFFNNTSSGAGGAGLLVVIHKDTWNFTSIIRNSTFSNNIAISGGGGFLLEFRAICYGCNLQVQHCLFFNNSIAEAAIGGGGACIQLQQGFQSAIIVSNSLFYQNSAVLSPAGGVLVYFTDASANNSIVIQDSVFFNNIGSFSGGLSGGGAMIKCFDRCDLGSYRVTGCLFHGNIALNLIATAGGSAGGGFAFSAYYVYSNSELIVSNTTFRNNIATNNGGGAVIHFSSLTSNSLVQFSNCSFESNSALTGNGGGAASIVYSSSRFESTNCTNTFDRCNFVNNSAWDPNSGGGALLIQTSQGGGNNIRNILSNCFFLKNVVNTIMASDSLSAFHVASSGGAVLITMPADQGPSLECLNCFYNFSINVFVPNPGCGFPMSSESCLQGFIMPNTIINQFTPYLANSATIVSNVTFTENKALSTGGIGGAFAIRNGLLVMKETVTFDSNAASVAGGALALSGTLQSQVSQGATVIFHDNAATQQTSISSFSRGFIEFECGSKMLIETSSNPAKSLISNSFQPVFLNRIGAVSMDPTSSLQVACPPGYKSVDNSVLNISTFLEELINPMLTNTMEFICVPCLQPFYTTKAGELALLGNSTAITIVEASCLTCPVGANCLGTNVVYAQPNYWGYLSPDDGEWSFTLCPTGYCCSNAAGCEPRSSTTACTPGRNASVPLCGKCLDGYSKDLRGNACTLTSECSAGSWAWPLGAFVCLLISAVMIFTATSKKKSLLSWVIPTVSFFVQNISLLYSSYEPNPSLSEVSAVIEGLFNLHFSSTSSSSASPITQVCAIPSITSDVEVIALQLLLPAMVLVCISIVFVAAMIRSAHNKTIKDVFLASLTNSILFVYTTVASVIASLLHCQEVSGGVGMRLYRGGSIQCYQPWQKILFIAGLVPIIVLPFALGVWHWRKRAVDSDDAIVRCVESPYKKECWYWAELTLFRRLGLAMTSSFGGRYRSMQALAFSCLFILYLGLQLCLQPFELAGGNITEAASLLVLVLTAMSLIRSGALEAVSDIQSEMGQQTRVLDIVGTVAFFVPLAIGLGFGAHYFRIQLKRKTAGYDKGGDIPLLLGGARE